MILDDIIIKRKQQLDKAKSKISYDEIVYMANNTVLPTENFKKAISTEKLAVIAEIKKSSPSKGLICDNFNPVEIAKKYEKSMANAISVITEEFYFSGCNDYLSNVSNEVSLPILRKDFIIDKYQIYEARAIGADAILLIASLLDNDSLIEFRDIAMELGLYTLVEVHNEEELRKVLDAKFDIIGINNRDLKTFDVKLETTRHLSRLIPKDKVIVSESGISNNQDMNFVKECGVNAVLVGETLMRSKDISETLKTLRGNL